MMVNNKEQQLKVLAKELLWVNDMLRKENLNQFEREELKEEHKKVTAKIIKMGGSASKIEQYMEEYKQLRLGEYQKWLNGEL